MSMFALLVLTAAQSGYTAPLDQDYISWHSEPNVRGTWSILTSCVVTLVLCVYSAVHMDIPHPYESTNQRKWNLARWVLAGIFAPELVVWAAWSQWSSARCLSSHIKSLQDTKERLHEESPFNPLHHHRYRSIHDLIDTWTLQHSFFVIMGGFQFPPSQVSPNPEPLRRPRCIIGADLFRSLLEHGHADKIPALTSKDLADRSKADHLAKTLSCIQALWLAVQLLGRLVARLSITELEVNTFVHVLCAIAMYALWMHKPLNIQQPIWVSTEGLDDCIPALSGLRWTTRTGLRYARHGTLDEILAKNLSPHLHDASTWDAPFECRQCSIQRSELGRIIAVGLWCNSAEIDPNRAITVLSHSRPDCFIDFVMHGSFKEPKDYEKLNSLGNKNRSYVFEVSSPDELEILLRQWQVSERAQIIDVPAEDLKLDEEPDLLFTSKSSKEMIAGCACMSLASCGYGALHAILWHHHFPTATEAWLWRVSAIIVAGDGLAVAATFVWVEVNDAAKKVFSGSNFIRLAVKIAEHASRAFFYTTQLIFLLSRVFLFIEAFISLRSQPPSAYETPQWSQWLPHL